MAKTPASPSPCPDCGRPLQADDSCLRCAMELALAAATQAPEAGADLPGSGEGFAAFADPVLPMEVGRFRLLARLGMGGMGTVYEAEDRLLGRTVALKMIRGFHFSSAEEMNRFQREAQAAARLDHPRIVPIYEIGALDGLPFLAMKLIRGGTLADRLKAGKPAREEAAGLMLKVASAVHHAHRQGVLHRDLKPSNILLDETGEPWLTDFGMARLEGTAEGLTVTGSQIGTPQYMSPEQAAGLVRGVTAASDVWALGAVFYQMLSGHPPYEGESNLAIMHAVVSSPPPRWQPASRRDRDLSVLVERCLQKKPDDRLPGAGLLAEELGRWLRGEPILTNPAPPVEKAFRWLKSHPAAVLAVLAPGAAALGWKSFTGHPITEAGRDAGDFVVTAKGTELRIENKSGLKAALIIRQPAPGRISLEDPYRTFGIKDGAGVAGKSLTLSLAGITRIVVDSGAGDDSIQIGGFEGGGFPGLDVNGGAGNDLVVFDGPITFAPGAGLELDLQDDAPQPGTDGVELGCGTALRTSGTGCIIVKSSGRIRVEKDVLLETVDGGITLESNQQNVPTPGEFKGLEIAGGFIHSEGKGVVGLSGRGGTRGLFQFGIYLRMGASIQGGTEGTVTLTGTGGTSDWNDSSGFDMEETCRVISKGAAIHIRGTGGGGPLSTNNHGIVMIGGLIQPGGTAGVTLEGRSGPTPGPASGVLLQGPEVKISSSGGEVKVTGHGGGTGDAGSCHGVNVWMGAQIRPGGMGPLTIEGTGGTGSGGGHVGVMISNGGHLQSGGGDIHVTGRGSRDAPGLAVRLPGRISVPSTSGRITLDAERSETQPGSVGSEP